MNPPPPCGTPKTQASFIPLTVGKFKMPIAIANEIERVAAELHLHKPGTIQNLIRTNWEVLKQSPDDLARVFMTFVMSTNKTNVLFPAENTIEAAWDELTKTASGEMQQDIQSYRNADFSAHGLLLYLTKYLTKHADKIPSIYTKIVEKSLTVGSLEEQIKKMQTLFPKQTMRYQSGEAFSSEKSCLGYLEHVVSGALPEDYVAKLTVNQAHALCFSDFQGALQGRGFEKYFLEKKLSDIFEKKIDFSFELLDEVWIQKKIDNKDLTFEQLTQLSEVVGTLALKDPWIQGRIDKGDLTFEEMILTSGLAHLSNKFVQWCIDNSKMTIQNALDATDWEKLYKDAENIQRQEEKSPCIIS